MALDRGKSKAVYNPRMSAKTIGTEQAKDILDSDNNAVYIDVRTDQEFMNGHVPRSVNIPVVLPDPSTRQMKPTPDFANVVSAQFRKDKRIIVGRQAGGRSQFAAELLVQEGFHDVSNLQVGSGGAGGP